MGFMTYLYFKYKEIWIGTGIVCGALAAILGGWYANEQYPLLTFRVAVSTLLLFGSIFSIRFIYNEYKLFKKQANH